MTSSYADPVVTMVLARRRDDNAFRSEVGRGRAESTETYAYRHLAWAWTNRPWRRIPLLRIAALMCDFDGVPDGDAPFGVACARAARATGSDQFEVKLAACQQLRFEQAYLMWRSMVPTLEERRFGIDWSSLLHMAEGWDQIDLENRRRTRRRLLEDFFQTSEPANETDSTKETTP